MVVAHPRAFVNIHRLAYFKRVDFNVHKYMSQIYLKADRIYHSSKTKTTETNLTEDVQRLNMEGWSLLLSLPGSRLNSWLEN